MTKNLVWRIQGITAGVTRDEVLNFFEEPERERISVKTLYPSVDDPHRALTATIEYTHELNNLEHIPRLRHDLRYELEIDRDFIGFTPLHSPSRSTHEADIIAVTGLAGHAIGSWSLGSRMWLRDFLPDATPTARILTYGYATKLQGVNLSISTLKDLAEEFLNNLIVMRNITAQGDQRPMILIGHSLGGLIIKLAMIQAKELNNGSRLPVRLIIFLATPHRGMNVDALRTVIKNEPPQRLIDELEPNSGLLRGLHQGFRQVSNRIQILSVFETQKTKTVIYDEVRKEFVRGGDPVILVTFESAVESRENEKSMPAVANHSTIAKMSRFQGSIYPMIKEMIQQSLMSTAQVKAALDHSDRHELENSGNDEISSPLARSPAPEQIDSPAIAAGFVSAGSGRDDDRTSSSCSETLIEQGSMIDPQNVTTGINALGLQDVNTYRDCTAASEHHPGSAVTDVTSNSRPTDSEMPSGRELKKGDAQLSNVECDECKVTIALFQGFYRCIPYSFDDAKHHGPKIFAVCPTCRKESKFCSEHGKLLIRSEQFRAGSNRQFRMCPDPKEESEDSILIKALKGRDIARLESLSSVPGLVNAPDQNKQTPLHISCHLGFEAEAICLLKNGASLEARDIVGRTPLSTAALAGNSALVLLLIESGADKASVDGWEQTPLHHACRAGSLVSVTALLTATPTKHLITYMDRLSSFSSTALMCACMAGEISIVRQLLEHGADPNITNRINGIVWLGTFRLPSSAVGLQILNLLASFGANLFGGDDYGWNHLHVNALRGRADVCRELIRISMNGPKLDGAQVTATTPLSPVRTLKLDVNATTRPGDTAIFLAARNGHLDTVRCLLELGADATIKCRIQDQDGRVDRESSTPLMAASYFGHAETVSCLISSGLDLHQASADMTPLYVAAQRGHLETCQKLLDAGADKNFMKKKDESVLSIAARNGKADVLELLLKKGAIAWPTAFLRKSNKTLRFESGVPEESRQKIKSLLRKYLGSGL